jgi:hypothetical protein
MPRQHVLHDDDDDDDVDDDDDDLHVVLGDDQWKEGAGGLSSITSLKGFGSECSNRTVLRGICWLGALSGQTL